MKTPMHPGIARPAGAIRRLAAFVRFGLLGCLATTAAAQSGPTHIGSRLLLPKEAPYTTGDTLRLETTWEDADSAVFDLGALLVEAEGARIRGTEVDPGVFRAIHRLSTSAGDLAADGTHAVRIVAWGAGGDSTAVDGFEVELDATAPPADQIALDPLPAVTRFDSIGVSGSAPEAIEMHLLRGSVAFDTVAVDTTGGGARFAGGLKLLVGSNRIQVRARDAAGNVSASRPSPAFDVVRVTGEGQQPRLLRWAFLDTLPGGAPTPVRAGDTIRLTTWWGVPDSTALADSLEVLADFSAIDGTAPGRTDIERVDGEAGAYRIVHYMAETPGRDDASNLAIRLTASGPTGFTNDSTLRLCVSNEPPVHVRSRILELKPDPYRSGDSLKIETVWSGRDGAAMKIRADLSSLLSDTSGVSWKTSQQGDSTWILVTRIPLNPEILLPDGPDKVIPVTARDTGCGATTDRSLRIDLDGTPPSVDGLILDPLPEVTTVDTLLVTGTAEGADFVFLLRDRTVKDVVQPDSVTFRFSGRVALNPGENRIQIRAEDAAGNSTALHPSPGILVARVAGGTLTVGGPYSRTDIGNETRDDIVLRDPEGVRDAVVRIFNLEGDCVAEIRGASSDREFRTHWNGTDFHGRTVSQGYYIVRAEWRTPGGKPRAFTQGLLLED